MKRLVLLALTLVAPAFAQAPEPHSQRFAIVVGSNAPVQDRPGLREAIDQAPENSIFIAGAGRVQQMSFNEFYQLDRAKSLWWRWFRGRQTQVTMQ